MCVHIATLPWENLILSLPASDYILNEGIILNVTTLYEEKIFLISIPYASSLKNTCQIIGKIVRLVDYRSFLFTF